MREGSRVKEKIELTLDTRQIVSIVLGSAVLLGVVFYLGVTVGKELGGPAEQLAGDPLERLDRQAEAAAEPLTFPDALTREDPEDRVGRVGAGGSERERALAEARVAAPEDRSRGESRRPEVVGSERDADRVGSSASAAPAASGAEAAAAPSGGGEAGLDAGGAAAAAPRPAVPTDLSAALAAGAGRKQEQDTTQRSRPAETKPSLDVSAALAKVDAREAAKPAASASKAAPAGGAFTVQVAALPSQREADALVKRLGEQGIRAGVTVADIPDRGTFYRVRVGRFGSREEAVRYLEDLRKQTRLDGFVASLEGG